MREDADTRRSTLTYGATGEFMGAFADFGLTEAQRREAVFGHRYERPGMGGERGELWCYTDSIAYPPGATARLYVCSTAHSCQLEITRDGAKELPVLERE